MYWKIFLAIVMFCVSTQAQSTEFTYQGNLKDGSNAANANYDFEFRLYAADSGGSSLGTLQRNGVPVTAGTFAVKLDFGSQFPGSNRFLEIAVRPAGGGSFATLSPRQSIGSSPYAIKSLSAETAQTAANSSQLGGVNANQFVVTTDPRMTDARTPAPGSNNYIQNAGATPQVASFNISGHGNIGGVLTSRIEAVETNGAQNAIRARNTGTGAQENIAIDGRGDSAPGFGMGGRFFGGSSGVSGFGMGGGSTASTYGVLGNAFGNAGSRIGVGGFSSPSAGVHSSYGVFGFANGPASTNYGVYGSAVGGTKNWAGYFAGDTYTEGRVSMGAEIPTFRLHIVDSSNSTLRVESTLSGGKVASFGGNGVFEIDGFGVPGGRFKADESGNVTVGRESVGGTFTVFGDSLLNTVTIANGIKVNVLGSAGTTQLCRNAINLISTCSSSGRYKENVVPVKWGLELVKRLSPVTFRWKSDKSDDFGLVAEDVAGIEPLLVTRNDKGEVEGVKYDRVGVVLINAVKEQQIQIDALLKLVKGQQQRIETLRKLLCDEKKTDRFCSEIEN